MANAGSLDGEVILSPGLIAEAGRERIRGQDLVLPFEVSWGTRFMRNDPNFILARVCRPSATPAGTAHAPSPTRIAG